MSEQPQPGYGDALTRPFWEGCGRHELLLQRCSACGKYQFYPRPFCLACYSDAVEWTAASGLGTVHSQVTVHIKTVPHLDPPYVVALVKLDEGPLYTTNIVGGTTVIGDRVRVAWREREAEPPVPVFAPLQEQ
jgi:uncharacterized protein